MLNQIIAKSLPFIPKSIVKSVASRYIAGATIDDAVRVVHSLNQKKATATIDVLGEFITTKQQAIEGTEMASQVLDAINANDLGSGLSIKLTSFGLGLDDEFCFANVRFLVEKAKRYNRFVRIDMENSPFTTQTLNIYRRIRAEGFDNTGAVIQAYMRRSEDDIRALIPLGAHVRLCKGIYVEDVSIAFKGKAEVQENYKKLLKILIENQMPVGIATHDDVLIDFARNYIANNNISKNLYEFQMLLGVREEKRNELLQEGHKVRIYVPFGSDWYGYSTRRLKENPSVAGHIFKAIFSGK